MAEEKKEIKTLDQIEQELSNVKEVEKKLKILKPLLNDKDYKNIKYKLTQLYSPLFLSQKPSSEYHLVYDSLSEGLEPIYFWILDFMRDSPPGGLGLSVSKGKEEFEASVSSGYFGEMGGRLTAMQKQASEYMGAINQVIKSIINLIYDLKEFETRISMYDKLLSKDERERQEGSYGIKGIWMDQVDVRKGKGSINALAQDLNFITMRDAFFYLEKASDIERLDLNDRVKNVLKRKWGEYSDWLKLSEKEIRNRFAVEKSYLRSQVGSLKLYASWVKPYLIAANKLKMSEFKTPDIVSSFSNMEMKLSVRGSKQIKPSSVSPLYTKFDNTIEEKYILVIAEMVFRSVPSALQGQGGRHYLHGGKTEIKFKSYVLDKTDKMAIEEQELYEDMDLLKEYIDPSLKALKEDLDRFLSDKKEEKKEEKSKKDPPKFFSGFDNPLKGAFSGFGEIFNPLGTFFHSTPLEAGIEKELQSKTEDKAKDTAKLIYDVYKKTHGMLAK